MRDFELINRVAVVTRATQGSGPAICEALGRQGAKIVLGGTRSTGPDMKAQRLSESGIEALSIEPDLTQVGHMENLLMRAVQTYGRVDIMVNNMLAGEPQPAAELPTDMFAQAVSVNLKSVFFGCQIAARHMLTQEPLQVEPHLFRGTIINIASVAGVVAISGHAAFCAAMAGVIAMTKALAAEWGPQGLRVVAVGVGLTESLLESRPLTEQSAHSAYSHIPLGMPTFPEAIGRAVAYLASDAASYTTGTTLYTDGGWLAYGYL